MEKAPDAFRTIGEVSDLLETPSHVLRFWESRFPQIKPVKRTGGRRYYRPTDVALLAGLRILLHDQGMTIKGVQKILREEGLRHVCALGDQSLGLSDGADMATQSPTSPPALDTVLDEIVALQPAAPAPCAPVVQLSAARAVVQPDFFASLPDETPSAVTQEKTHPHAVAAGDTQDGPAVSAPQKAPPRALPDVPTDPAPQDVSPPLATRLRVGGLTSAPDARLALLRDRLVGLRNRMSVEAAHRS